MTKEQMLEFENRLGNNIKFFLDSALVKFQKQGDFPLDEDLDNLIRDKFTQEDIIFMATEYLRLNMREGLGIALTMRSLTDKLGINPKDLANLLRKPPSE